MNKKDIDAMESIQAQFGASLIGVRHSTSTSGILMELGLPKISYLIHKRKLKFWRRLCVLPEENWAKQALLECHNGIPKNGPQLCLLPGASVPVKSTWSASYMREIDKIISCYDLQHLPMLTEGAEKHSWTAISNKLQNYECNGIVKDIIDKQSHSLRALPEYPRNYICQKYLEKCGFYRETLAKFRLGNAGLGNRDTPNIKVCPACNSGPNIESHLVFNCSAMNNLKLNMNDSVKMDQFINHHSEISDSDHLLKLFLGDDWSSNETLLKRGEYLDILLQKHKEYTNALQT